MEDLGSRTGTWLNGERISGRRRVRAGDLVEIGDYDLVVAADGLELDGAAPPPLPPAAAAPAERAGRRAGAAAGGLRRTAALAALARWAGLLVGWLLARLLR